MSTRANVIIKDSYDKLWFYRHSDGYPEGTLPTLKKFLSWVKEGKIRGNVGQSAGWLIILGAEEYNYNHTLMDNKEYGKQLSISEMFKPSDWKVGAYEPTSGQHGDIEYLYEIDLEKKQINVMEPDGKLIETID